MTIKSAAITGAINTGNGAHNSPASVSVKIVTSCSNLEKTLTCSSVRRSFFSVLFVFSFGLLRKSNDDDDDGDGSEMAFSPLNRSSGWGKGFQSLKQATEMGLNQVFSLFFVLGQLPCPCLYYKRTFAWCHAHGYCLRAAICCF